MGRYVAQRHAVRRQGLVRHLAGAHGCHDGLEIFRRGIAAAEQRGFALVELGVGELDVALHDRDEHVAATVRDEAEAPFHRAGIAGGIEHDVEEFTAGDAGEFRLIPIAQRHGRCDAHLLQGEIQPVLAPIDGRDLGTAQPGEDHRGQPDGARPHDEHALAGRHGAASHGMGADGEKLQHRRLVQGDAFGLVDEALRHREKFGHRAIAVHAEHLDAHAAVGLSLPAGHAVPARQVRHHIDGVARGQAAACIGLFDHAGEFMPHDARIRQIGLVAGEDVQVGAADAHAFHAQQHFARGTGRQRLLQGLEVLRGFADDGQHGNGPVGHHPAGRRQWMGGLASP